MASRPFRKLILPAIVFAAFWALECMLCQTCITVCAKDALRVSLGIDIGGGGRLRPRLPLGRAA